MQIFLSAIQPRSPEHKKKATFQEALASILAEDPRYTEGAYVFLRESLDFTMKELAKPAAGEGRHVSGLELLDGVRTLALREFEPGSLVWLGRRMW